MQRSESEKVEEAEQKIFYENMATFPLKAQEFITDLSSQFIEADVYGEFRENPRNTQDLITELKSLKLEESSIEIVLNFFNLPYEKK